MKLSDWLDKQEAEKSDVTQADIPRDIAYDSKPDETIYFKEIRPCTMLCTERHPFAKVERHGHWYAAMGQDKKAGIHSNDMQWKLFTRDRGRFTFEVHQQQGMKS